jgi:general secretion pathway protein H
VEPLTAFPPSRDAPARGFTFIELVVTLLILGVIISLIGLNLVPNDSDRARDEAQQLTLLIQSARDEAILRGVVYALQMTENGYRFLRLNDEGRLAPFPAGDLFGPRALPERVTVALVVEGLPETDAAGLILDSSGLLPAFVITLRAGRAVWYIEPEADGKLRLGVPPGAHAG